MYHCRCVERLSIRFHKQCGHAYPQLPLVIMGASLMTQSSSLRTLALTMRELEFTGADAAKLVSPGTTSIPLLES